MDFAAYCCAVAIQDGFDTIFVHSVAFQKFLMLGARMASTAFGASLQIFNSQSRVLTKYDLKAHLDDKPTRQWIAFYTALIIYFDDLMETDASMVKDFQSRFLAGKPQREPLMNQFAKFLNRAWDHFPPTCANLIVSSALDFVTSLIIDADHPDMQVGHLLSLWSNI